jgi:putative proteasome-type protease
MFIGENQAMTYCVGMKLKRGLVFMSDTRTNAGVDNISVFKKMFQWEVPGERSLTLMTAGNLATTQAVISLLNERALPADERGTLSIVEAPSMFQVARLVGETLREVIADQSGVEGPQADSTFGATMILGGQVRGGEPRMFLIYPEGNFVEACDDTPFFQIGETKYGKPILVRAYDPEMRFEEAVKLLLLSFDSTLKANLSVGMPFDLHMYEAETFRHGQIRRIEPDDAFFADISSGWGDKLREAFDTLPDYSLE